MFFSSSSFTPKNSRFLHILALLLIWFSPTPAVNTIVSIPPIDTPNFATYCAIFRSYAFNASIALSFPSSAAASTSLTSAETPDIPSKPDSLFNIKSIFSGAILSFFIMYVTTDGSKSPLLAHIIIPPSGVNPILVSTDFPPSTAHILAPCPI